jgi:hypothetical protein
LKEYKNETEGSKDWNSDSPEEKPERRCALPHSAINNEDYSSIQRDPLRWMSENGANVITRLWASKAIISVSGTRPTSAPRNAPSDNSGSSQSIGELNMHGIQSQERRRTTAPPPPHSNLYAPHPAMAIQISTHTAPVIHIDANVILDSGSAVSIMSSDMANAIGQTPKGARLTIQRGNNDRTTLTLGRVQATVRHGYHTYQWTFHVVPNAHTLDQSLVFGNDYFKKMKIELYANDKHIRINTGHTTFMVAHHLQYTQVPQ